jgi:chloramphenicol 3-O phosphotransferase
MIPIADVTKPGQIVILNGAPRSGKSSIVAVIQETFDGPWMNLGVDIFVRSVTPRRYRPGIGLRPGEDDHELAPLVAPLYAALYDSIAAHSRAGLNVVVDVGHHDAMILVNSARRLVGLPVLFVGVRCPIDVVMRRRNAGQVGREGEYVVEPAGEPVPEAVQRWQDAVHVRAFTTSRSTRRVKLPRSARRRYDGASRTDRRRQRSGVSRRSKRSGPGAGGPARDATRANACPSSRPARPP